MGGMLQDAAGLLIWQFLQICLKNMRLAIASSGGLAWFATHNHSLLLFGFQPASPCQKFSTVNDMASLSVHCLVHLKRAAEFAPGLLQRAALAAFSRPRHHPFASKQKRDWLASELKRTPNRWAFMPPRTITRLKCWRRASAWGGRVG